MKCDKCDGTGELPNQAVCVLCSYPVSLVGTGTKKTLSGKFFHDVCRSHRVAIENGEWPDGVGHLERGEKVAEILA